MIEQLKQFVDRQTPVSLLLAVVAVVFFVTSANRLLIWMTDGLVYFVRILFFPSAWNQSSLFDLSNLGQTLIVQVLILLLLKRFIR